MSCLAYVVDVIVEGQSVVYCHTETFYRSCNRNSNVGNCDIVDLWYRPLSSSGTNDDRFGFVHCDQWDVKPLLTHSRRNYRPIKAFQKFSRITHSATLLICYETQKPSSVNTRGITRLIVCCLFFFRLFFVFLFSLPSSCFANCRGLTLSSRLLFVMCCVHFPATETVRRLPFRIKVLLGVLGPKELLLEFRYFPQIRCGFRQITLTTCLQLL